MFIVIIGSFKQGFSYNGPFNSKESAQEWADAQQKFNWNNDLIIVEEIQQLDD